MGVTLDEGPSPHTNAHMCTHAHTQAQMGLSLLAQITWLHGNTFVDRHDKIRIDPLLVIWWHICHIVFVQSKAGYSLKHSPPVHLSCCSPKQLITFWYPSVTFIKGCSWH